MRIEHIIYSSHLSETATETELRAAAAKLAEISRETLTAAYPDAKIEVTVKHGVSGVGSGITVIEDDGRDNSDVAESANALVERATSNDEIWA